MKKKFFTLIMTCLIVGLPMYADGKDKTTIGSETPVIVKIEYPKNPNSPKAPSKQHIECWYCDGELSFDFVIPEGECTLYLTDYATGFMTQYAFDSADHADIYVGSLPNGGSIEINTTSGHTYYGEIVIDN